MALLYDLALLFLAVTIQIATAIPDIDGVQSCRQNPTGASWRYPWHFKYNAALKEWQSDYDAYARVENEWCAGQDIERSNGTVLTLTATLGDDRLNVAGSSNSRNVYRVAMRGDDEGIAVNKTFYFWLAQSDTCKFCFHLGPKAQVLSIDGSLNN